MMLARNRTAMPHVTKPLDSVSMDEDDASEALKWYSLRKLWPLLVSLGSAAVMLLAFFIPSIQDQWDRYQSREVIQQYEHLGDQFFEEERFDMAEKAYEKAFEMSEEKRLDIEVKRLSAKVNRVSLEPKWGAKPPEDIQDIDFQFLLHLQKDKADPKQRVFILNSYGIYLSSVGRTADARAALEEALQLDPNDVLAYVNLGNLFDQMKDKAEAEKYYRKALTLQPTNIQAYYNAGLLYAEQNRWPEAVKAFESAQQQDPEDADIARELANARQHSGMPSPAPPPGKE
jgi:tetratricopeptide (TPR) repeat protein